MKVPEIYRVLNGVLGTRPGDGNKGFFLLPGGLRVIATDGLGWEHASVSLRTRCPTWAEMCRVKGLFWEPEDVVMQLHPRQSEYVNCHPNCLHLWRPIGVDIPTPPPWMVGPKS